MASSLVKIDVHLVFHVKSTSVVIRDMDIVPIHKYMGGVLKSIDAIPICIGGINNHVHILCSLPSTITMADLVRAVKANTSRWIKTLDPYYRYFEWQKGYGAFSVSPSLLSRTIRYINTQAEHHRKTLPKDEFIAFLNAYHIEYNPDYVLSD